MLYTTQYVFNLMTGEPFTFDVPDKTIQYMKKQQEMVQSGEATMLGSFDSLTMGYELSFFPVFREVIKIWFENGYTEELMSQILREFGLVDESFIEKLLADEEYVDEVRPWFEGITRDGERSARTLRIVYDKTKEYFSA